MPASRTSVGVRGAVRGAVRDGGGTGAPPEPAPASVPGPAGADGSRRPRSARRSIFPVPVSGIRSTRVIRDGSMYGGSDRARWCRSSAASACDAP